MALQTGFILARRWPEGKDKGTDVWKEGQRWLQEYVCPTGVTVSYVDRFSMHLLEMDNHARRITITGTYRTYMFLPSEDRATDRPDVLSTARSGKAGDVLGTYEVMRDITPGGPPP